MNTPIATIITPTTGKQDLLNLIGGIVKQNIPVCHLLLWDSVREEGGLNPIDILDQPNYMVNNIEIKGNTVNGGAKGSSLRAVGLMAAQTELILFADDDVVWEDSHLSTMLTAIQNSNWAYCKRKIWTKLPDGAYEFLGVDEFESVGEEAKTPYKMVDNNCMIFRRRFGASAACLYRETKEYNDDRLFYDFMKKYAGEPSKTLTPTINQVCPTKLIEFFRVNCTK